MSNDRSIEARNGGLSRAIEGRLLPILAFFTILFGVLLPTSASAMQCVRLVDPSGFIAKVSWYKAGDLTFSQNQTSGKYDVAIKPNIAPARETYLILGQEDCVFEILTQQPAIAIVRIVGGEIAREFVNFAISETAQFAVNFAFTACPIEIGCDIVSTGVSLAVADAVEYALDQLPEHREIIYVGTPSSYFYTDVSGSIYNPSVVTSTSPTAQYTIAPTGPVEDAFLSYFDPPRGGVFHKGFPLSFSENVNLGTCASFCTANQANAGCQGFNFDPATNTCLTLKMPALGDGCVNAFEGGSGAAFYHLKTAPAYQYRDCSVSEREDQARQQQLEDSRG